MGFKEFYLEGTLSEGKYTGLELQKMIKLPKGWKIDTTHHNPNGVFEIGALDSTVDNREFADGMSIRTTNKGIQVSGIKDKKEFSKLFKDEEDLKKIASYVNKEIK